MRTLHILSLALALIFLTACGSSEKKEEVTSEDTKTETKAAKSNSIDLKQNGDYSQLFALDAQCKMTLEEIATLYGIATDNIKETYNTNTQDGGHYCSYNLTLNNGTKSVFGITSFKMSMTDVEGQISNWTNGSYEKQFLKISSSGDNYIWKHPNQGWFMLLNPNHANGIKVTYRNMLKVDKNQSEYLEQKGIQAIDYLIEKYKN